MAIFQKIKDTVKSAYNAVASAFSGKNQVANAASSLQGRYIPPDVPITTAVAAAMPRMTSAPTGDAYKPVLQTPNPIGSAYNNSSGSSYMTPTPSGIQLPVKINAGQQRTGSSRSSQLSSSDIGSLSDTTISAKTLGLQSNSMSSSGSSTGASPLVLSSAPSSINPNNIDNTKLAGALAGVKKYNQTTGQLEDVVSNEKTNEQIAKDTKDLYESILGTRQSVYDDPDVIKARENKRKIEEAIKVPTSELNAIIAKQTQDLLQLRMVGSKEGVTEAVYGEQANAINYNAAIRALPLQASISALQGNLDLATEYLSELTKTKSDQINNQYNYNEKLLSAISGAIDKKDQRVYEEIKTANENSKREALDLENFKESILTKILEKNPNVSTTTINRIANATNRADVVNSASKHLGASISDGSTNNILSSLPTSIQSKIISLADGLKTTDIVKKYNSTVDSINVVNSIDSNSKNPADHQQIVYAFAKSLDPDSVVRETEYDTIKKYAQGMISRYGKEISNAINGTGFLSDAAIKNIKATMNKTYESRKPLYENQVKETSRVINNIAGADVAKDLIIDYSGGVSGLGTDNQTTTNNVTITPDDNDIFNSVVIPKQTVTPDRSINSPLFNFFK